MFYTIRKAAARVFQVTCNPEPFRWHLRNRKWESAPNYPEQLGNNITPTSYAPEKNQKGEPASKPSTECKKKRKTPSTPPPPKRARSLANLETEEEDEIIAVSPSSIEKLKQSKGVCRVTKQGREWEVPGPDKSDEDCGRIRLDEVDRNSLHRQCNTLTGFTTSAFHNLVCNHFYERGVRCTEADFVPSLQGNIDTGKVHGWKNYLSLLTSRESGMQYLEWDSANVILIQVFWGPFDDGHFASLILDRTRKGNPLAVYADSLREYKPEAIDKLKNIPGNTPLQNENWTWIEANVPRQGCGTNDCGVIASCFSLLYVLGLENGGLLSENEVETFSPVQSVTLQIPMEHDMASFGLLGRRYMSESMRLAKWDFKKPLFAAKVIWK